jgi:hypothetical protein
MEELVETPGQIALSPPDERLLGDAGIGLARQRRGTS